MPTEIINKEREKKLAAGGKLNTDLPETPYKKVGSKDKKNKKKKSTAAVQ